MAAVRGLYEAIMKPNQTVLILSPTQRQSNNLFRRMKYFLNKNARMPKNEKIPIENTIVRETRTELEFDNGSMIIALPAKESGDNIRGYVAHIIIIDEGGYIDDRVYTTIEPMFSTTEGTLILLGSPNGRNNKFYKAFADPKESFSVHHYPSGVSPLISKEFLEKQRDILPDLHYRQEYGAEFVESAGVMFPLSLIDKCINEDCPLRDQPIPQFKYYLGYDPARVGTDDAVALILENRGELPRVVKYCVVNTWEMRGKTLDDQVNFISNLHDKWRFEKIIIDATAVGGGVVDPLVNKQFPVEAFTFSIKTKPEAYFHTLREMESGNLMLPPHDKLRKQMSEIRQEKRDNSEHVKIYHPAKTGQDDYPTALVLAMWGTKKALVPLVFGTARKPFFSE